MRPRDAAAIAALLLALVSCDSGSSTGSGEGGSESLLVMAASSLTDVAPALVDEFERANPGVDVEVSLGASSSLAVGIREGSPADVFISANSELVERLDDDGLTLGTPIVVAANDVVVAAAPTSTIASIDDFGDEAWSLGACAEQVPCGFYADQLFAAVGVVPSFDTREPNVRSVVAKIRDGELDGGVVYRSDLEAFADELREITLPSGVEVSASVTAVALAEAANPTAATAFVEFLGTSAAREVLTARGFDAS